MVGISWYFMLNYRGYSDDVILAQRLPNDFTNQRFVVIIQIRNELVSFMTAKSFVSVSSILKQLCPLLSRFQKDVMFKGKMFCSTQSSP